MTFVYTNTVPNPPNLPSTDVNAMQTNTATIDSWVQRDHFGFNTDNGGLHNKVSLPNQGAPAIPTNMNAVFFAKAVGGNSWPHWVNGIGVAGFQITGSAAAVYPSAVANGYSFLPGGLIIQWGKFLIPTTVAVNVPMNINFPTNMLWGNGILDATGNPGASVRVSSLATNQLTFALVNFGTINVTSVYWMAIGI